MLYSDGWVKDADLNTARSATVEPLPFHAMRSYPDPERGFPESDAHRRYLDEYQTRSLDDRGFRGALRGARAHARD